MEYVRGTVAWSRAGHDKGSFFTILSIEGRFALIADGRGRSVSSPKRKNLIHLGFTETVLDEEILSDDSKIRQALRRFRAQS